MSVSALSKIRPFAPVWNVPALAILEIPCPVPLYTAVPRLAVAAAAMAMTDELPTETFSNPIYGDRK